MHPMRFEAEIGFAYNSCNHPEKPIRFRSSIPFSMQPMYLNSVTVFIANYIIGGLVLIQCTYVSSGGTSKRRT